MSWFQKTDPGRIESSMRKHKDTRSLAISENRGSYTATLTQKSGRKLAETRASYGESIVALNSAWRKNK